MLVAGEPGAGKTSLACALADQAPSWLRYFIGHSDRCVQESTEAASDVEGVDASWDIASFLHSIGLQLASQRPKAFDVNRLTVVVN